MPCAERPDIAINANDFDSVESIPVGFAEIVPDAELTLVRANRLFYETLGCSEQDLKIRYNDKLFLVMEPDDLGPVRAAVVKVLQGEAETFECTFRALASQPPRLVRVSGRLLRRGGGEAALLACTCVKEEQSADASPASEAELQQYNLALAQAGIDVLEYDIASKSTTVLKADGTGGMTRLKYENVPWDFINGRLIAERSLPDVIAAYSKIEAGEPFVEYVVGCRLSVSQPFSWKRRSYKTIYDDKGKPVKAVGISSDVTAEVEKKHDVMLEEKYAAVLSDDVIMSCRADVTKNEIVFYCLKRSCYVTSDKRMKIENIASAEVPNIPFLYERERYLRTLAPKNLLEAFDSGKSTITLDYRREFGDGKIAWVRLVILLRGDAETGDVIGYAYLREVDCIKKKELSLDFKAERVAGSGLYNKKTFVEMMTSMTRDSDFNYSSAALIVICVGKYPEITSVYGYDAAEKITSELGRLLSLRYGPKSVVGQLRCDMFAVFAIGRGDRIYISEQLQTLAETVGQPYFISDVVQSVTLSSVAAYPDPQTEYAQLLEDACAQVLKNEKKGGAHSVLENAQQLEAESLEKAIGDNLLKNSQVDDTEFQTAFTRATISIFFSNDIKNAVRTVFQQLCRYYQAESAMIATLGDKGRTVEIVYEWYDENVKRRISDDEKVFAAEMFSRWIEAHARGEVVVMEDAEEIKEQHPLEYEFYKRVNIKRRIAVPCTLYDGTIGYLCIDNPAGPHRGDASLLKLLSRLIIGELEKHELIQKEQHQQYYEPATGVLNANSFNARINGIKEEELTSFGVLCVTVNDYKKTRDVLGGDYARDVIVALAASLQNYFSAENVYQTADDEFIALSVNVRESLFMKNIEWFKTDTERDFPALSLISVGYAWDEFCARPNDILNVAKERMAAEKRKFALQKGSGDGDADYGFVQNELQKELNDGVYRMYLRPRFLLSTGEVSGAEAVIRKRDGKNLLTADKFLPQLTKQGLMDKIDYFMLREGCLLLSKWKRNKVRMLSLSVNLSQQLLLQEDAVPSIARILTTFRRTPLNMLELKFMPDGNVNGSYMMKIGKDLSALGCRLALDNYGSHYSSLSLLTSTMPDLLLVDRDVLKNTQGNVAAKVIMKNFFQTCRELKVQAIADGVETQEQVEMLKKLGCDYAQGNYYDLPMSVKDFESKYIKTN